MKKSLHDSFNCLIPENHICEFCRDDSKYDTFNNLEKALKYYHIKLCDTCYDEHRMNDFIFV